MNKIQFINEQAPAINANNLNLMQTNAENAIETAKSEAISTASTNTNNAINNKIQYGTSLPGSASDGTVFLLYS